METLWMTLFIHKHVECLWINQQWWENGWLMRLTSPITSVVLKENKKIAKCFTIITSKPRQKHQRREKNDLSAFIYIKLMLIWFHTTIRVYALEFANWLISRELYSNMLLLFFYPSYTEWASYVELIPHLSCV